MTIYTIFLLSISYRYPVYIMILCTYYCHTRLHLGLSAYLRIWQVSACKMEPQSGTIITLEPASHPASQPPSQPCTYFDSLNIVRCPHPNCSIINKVCAVSPPPSICFSHPNCFPYKKVCAVSPPPSLRVFCAVSPPPSLWLCAFAKLCSTLDFKRS